MEQNNCFFKFEGVHVGQTPGIQEQFKKILNEFDRIIEIGTHAGGLTLFLYKNKNNHSEVISYDINYTYNQVPKHYHFNINFRIGDCFFSVIHNEIKELISDKTKKVLLLCDGGNKIKEFNVFSQYLKVDDVIMCHDYAETIEEFNKFKLLTGWLSTPESTLGEISESIKKNNLLKHQYYDDFKSVFWGIFVKGN